jgi:hypothetical protein
MSPPLLASPYHLIGMQGVYLTAAELSRRGFIVSPTSRGAFGADLLVTDQRCRKAWSVQVKTTERPASWCLISTHAKETASDTHIYVFVSLKDDCPDFMVVPSRVVAAHARRQGEKMLVFDRANAGSMGWDAFGGPSAD